jgi:Peptidase MA superfamily
MDIFSKLRIWFWVLVTGLWGTFMYQYIVSDFKTDETMILETNPFAYDDLSSPDLKTKTPTALPHIPLPRQNILPSSMDKYTSTKTFNSSLFVVPLKTDDIKGLSSQDFTKRHTAEERMQALNTALDKANDAYPAIPDGFSMSETRHFVIYEEGKTVSKKIINALEHLHGNIMLDLIAFSPWTRDKKVFLFFCSSQDTYQKITGRPAWSGGTASLKERKIFVYKNPGTFGIIAHELTHIYFDSFFSKKPNPLWLSEGMAVYIQVERGASVPIWLSKNLKMISRGAGFKLKDLMRIEKLEEADEESIRLWYAQSYSIVRFLMKMKAGDSFYRFCNMIKNENPVHTSLYRAYGMPYNKISALEYAWRYDVKTGKISGLNK